MNSKQKVNRFIKGIENKWKKRSPDTLSDIGSFTLEALDDSINFAENYFKSGKEKKDIVIYIMSVILDNLILKSLPAYVLPFEKIVRIFLIKIVFSVSIDFIVRKYNQSSWVWKGKEFYEQE
jgi:hypothetical protein